MGVKFDSPLRYPGGKAALAPFLAKTIAKNDLGRRAAQIHISNMDAGRFLVERLPRGRGRRHVFAPENLQLPTPELREDALAWTMT